LGIKTANYLPQTCPPLVESTKNDHKVHKALKTLANFACCFGFTLRRWRL